MKKILSLLTLLLCVASGAWAQETVQTTLFQWAYDNTSSVQTITNGTALTGVTGGTLTPNTTNSSKAFSAKDKISSYGSGVPNDMKAAGTVGSDSYYLKNGSGALYIEVQLSSGTFQAGDIVYICATGKWGVSIVNSNGGKDGDVISKIETGSTSVFNIKSATIPESFTASDKLYFARADGTTCGICAIKIVRSATKTVTSKDLTGIKINGTSWDISGLSGNAATITDEVAGPPTVDFIYVENYDDNTSSSNKTESVVAVKDNGSYKAISTVLTNNVTLTFTNVSNVLFSMTDPTGPTETLAAKGSAVAVAATFAPGCSAKVFNGHSSAEAQMVYADEINLNGSGNSYFQAIFTSSLAEGDIITSSNTNTEIFKIGISNASGSSTKVTFPYTIPAGSNLIGKKVVYVFKNATPATFATFTITRPKTIDTQEFAGVKKGTITLTETTDYTVSNTTITLTDAHKAVIAPTDIKLINHITYDDATTADEDVDVTLTKNEDFFEGTATIGITTYTVKVPVDASTPILSLSAASGSIELNSYTPTGTVKVTLTGVNLANGTFTAPIADGVTIAPKTVEITNGTLNQEFTITSSATTAASTEIVFSYTGAESKTYTLAYTKAAKRELTQTDVTGATTWDWSKAGNNTIELNANTSPTNAEEFLMASLPEVNNDDNFNSQALMIMTQYPTRGNNKYFQGYSIKFNTTVPGTIDVKFSNTGDSRPYRYLRVNGTQTLYKSGDGNWVDATGISVPAGEVVIDFYIPDATDPQERSGDVVGTTMCRVSKIVFTPTITKTITSAGYATLCSEYPLDFTNSGLTAYIATVSGTTVSFSPVTSIPANTGVLLKGTAGEKTINVATGTTEDVTDNKLVGVLVDTHVDKGAYVLMNGTSGVGFYKTNNVDGFTVGAGTAYLPSNVAGARTFIGFDFEDNTTTGVESSQFTVHSSQLVYNLNGQRVDNPKKGLYIVNGKKVIK